MSAALLDTDTTELRTDGGVRVLSVASLALTHFRNYASARLEISAAPVILTGHNGAGKTNILEAVSLLTPGRGLRRARLSELDAQGAESSWTVAASVSGMQGEVKIGTGRDPESVGEMDKRLVKIDGKMARSQSELARHLSILWLTPQMEQLFQEGTSAARKFLDRLVYSFDAEHASRINEYEFAMRERNKLLQTGGDPFWLDALEATMAETGAAIAGGRLEACEHINHTIAASPLSFPKARIRINGFLEDRLAAGEAAVQGEEAFKMALRSARPVDRVAGRTLTGTHRSEMTVLHIEKQMVAGSCSTGEQKALLLSIVLAQARSGAQWHRVVPVLLLDEVVAHLDATRRLELFEEICQIGAQSWMTGTDAALFAGMEEKAQYFQVENGRII